MNSDPLSEAPTLTFCVSKYCKVPGLHSVSCKEVKATCEICIHVQVWILNRHNFQRILGLTIWFCICIPC